MKQWAPRVVRAGCFGIVEIRSSDMRTKFLEIVRRVTPWIRTRLRRRLADEERCTLKDIHSDIDMKVSGC
jgi:hypothetical protein